MDFPPIRKEKKEDNQDVTALSRSLFRSSEKDEKTDPMENRAVEVKPLGSPPCNRACPAKIDIKRYITLIADGLFIEAEEIIRKDNPMAGVCGWICSRPCEKECSRNEETGRPVSIRALQKFACKFAADSGIERKHARPSSQAGSLNKYKDRRVAVVGAGPAGLSAARDLALAGCKVTVYDKRDRAGGLVAFELPSFRLPREVVENDILAILETGVKLELGKHIGAGELQNLHRENNAVVLATGAQRCLKGGLPGEECVSGIFDAVTLLRKKAFGEALPTARTALVVGSSSMAVSVARMLAREKIPNVFMVFPETSLNIAADPEEVQAAKEEGVRFLQGMMPEEVTSRSGRFSGLSCRRIMNAEKSFFPLGRVNINLGEKEIFSGELLVYALNRESGWTEEDLPDFMKLGTLGTIQADPIDLTVGKKSIFGAGEAITGPRGVVEAVASGRHAASQILKYFDEIDKIGTGEEDGMDNPHTGMKRAAAGSMIGHPWEVGKRSERVKSSTIGFRLSSKEESRGRTGESVSPRPLSGEISKDPARAEHPAQAAAWECLRCGPCLLCSSCSIHCPDGFVVSNEEHQLIRVNRQSALSPEELNGRLLLAVVDSTHCRGCGSCEQACPYSAARVRLGQKRNVSVIEADFCRGCGKCAAVCPTSAITYPISPAHLIEAKK